MFKISRLTMVSFSGEEYSYDFEMGINYYKGANSTGKTEFYYFIDFMLGSSRIINDKLWFKDSLKHAILRIVIDDIIVDLKRTQDGDENYIRYADEDWHDSINHKEYRERINSIILSDEDALIDIRNFTGEDLTYRTFTLFNFLGEKSLGYIIDFFDKGRDLKYAIKLSAVLNYIFNPNLDQIKKLKTELAALEKEVNEMNTLLIRSNFIIDKINDNLIKLNIDKNFTGKNIDAVLSEVNKLKRLDDIVPSIAKRKTIVELESIYSNISDQIKIYDTKINDSKAFLSESSNKLELIETLNNLCKDKPHLSYLTQSIIDLTVDLEKSISFNNYIINSNTIKELKAQLKLVKKEMKRAESKMEYFSASEKTKSLSLIEELLSLEIDVDVDLLNGKVERIKDLKNRIKTLQNADDNSKIDKLSIKITELYSSALNYSDVIRSDFFHTGFSLKYYKKGNMIQPVVSTKDDESKSENYTIGSLARHTLLQLCGYLSFLDLLISENKYPVMPILIIDHISKPFDADNRNAIGIILKTFLSTDNGKKCQIFIFDDESYNDLSIVPSHEENLVNSKKTGFNPFYTDIGESSDYVINGKEI